MSERKPLLEGHCPLPRAAPVPILSFHNGGGARETLRLPLQKSSAQYQALVEAGPFPRAEHFRHRVFRACPKFNLIIK